MGDDTKTAILISSICDVISCRFQFLFCGRPVCFVAAAIAEAQELAQFALMLSEQANTQIAVRNGWNCVIVQQIELFQIAAISTSDLCLRRVFLCVDDDIVHLTEDVDGCFGTGVDDKHIVFRRQCGMVENEAPNAFLFIVHGMGAVIDTPYRNGADTALLRFLLKFLHFADMTDIDQPFFRGIKKGKQGEQICIGQYVRCFILPHIGIHGDDLCVAVHLIQCTLGCCRQANHENNCRIDQLLDSLLGCSMIVFCLRICA